MKPSKPVKVSKGGFIFCKWSIAILLWVGFIFRWKWPVVVSFMVLGLNALLRVKRAPLILLYTYTVDKFFKKPKQEILDDHAMRFAHTLGTILLSITLILLFFVHEKVGFVVLFFVAIAKTLGALGFCTALRMYGCVNGKCCSFLRKK